MSSRKRTRTMPIKVDNNSNDLPSRKGTATAKHKTSLPGYSMPFHKFIYIFSAVVVAFTLFNAYRILQWKTVAGGWTGLLLGKMGENPSAASSSDPYASSSSARPSSSNIDHPRQSVDYHIKALAQALGLPSKDLAFAIAQAIREHIPPASLSSVSAAEATQSGEIVNIIVGEGEGGGEEGEAPGTTLKDRLSMLSSFDDTPEIGGLD